MIEKNTDEEREYYLLVKKMFDILAPVYDLVTVPFSSVRDKVVNWTNAVSGSKVLDVATGTGKQAFAFAKKGYDVIGIDISEAMLEVANRKNEYQKMTFKLADATNLPFEDSIFDISCVSFALHDMPFSIREKTLNEMVRVTKPQGMIVIVDYALRLIQIVTLLFCMFIYMLMHMESVLVGTVCSKQLRPENI